MTTQRQPHPGSTTCAIDRTSAARRRLDDPGTRAGAGRARRSGSPPPSAATAIPSLVFFVALLGGLVADRRPLDRRRVPAHRRASLTLPGHRRRQPAFRQLARGTPHARPHRGLADRLDRRRRGRPADRRRSDRARAAPPSGSGASRRSPSSRWSSSPRPTGRRRSSFHEHRPRVLRLENLPVNASYPSGHTAASIAVYGGPRPAAHLEVHERRPSARSPGRSRSRSRSTSALSRMYRGMHYPLDVTGGALLGIAALCVIVFACRAAGAAADRARTAAARAT